MVENSNFAASWRSFHIGKYFWVEIIFLLNECRVQTVEDLETRCRESGIEIVTRQSFLNDPSESVRNLRRQVIGTLLADWEFFLIISKIARRMLALLSVCFMWWRRVESCVKCTNKVYTVLATYGFLSVGTKTTGMRPILPRKRLSVLVNRWKKQLKVIWRPKHWIGIKTIKEQYLEWYYSNMRFLSRFHLNPT